MQKGEQNHELWCWEYHSRSCISGAYLGSSSWRLHQGPPPPAEVNLASLKFSSMEPSGHLLVLEWCPICHVDLSFLSFYLSLPPFPLSFTFPFLSSFFFFGIPLVTPRICPCIWSQLKTSNPEKETTVKLHRQISDLHQFDQVLIHTLITCCCVVILYLISVKSYSTFNFSENTQNSCLCVHGFMHNGHCTCFGSTSFIIFAVHLTKRKNC